MEGRTTGLIGMRMFPFTTEQWQELQRQAMVYKHMVASLPIPPELLFPSAAKSFPETPAIYLPPPSMLSGCGMNLRLASGADPEPGRCRRTDGKKWRCARDAAPDQKYCERHLNRGRPRSRKPVEQQRRTRSRVTTCAIADSAAMKSPGRVAVPDPDIELNLPIPSLDSKNEPRASEDWLKSYSENLTSKEQLEIVDSEQLPHYEQLPNLNYSDSSSWYPFLNCSLSALGESNVAGYNEPPRRFFDAWSSENNNKQPLSALTLSIASAIEEETEQVRHEIKSHHQLGWMASNLPLGGPLAEVLHSSNITSQESSPRDSPSRLVSSPSGVLQKPRVSLSDSSSSSSPTFTAAASRSDFTLQWMNLNN